LSTDTLAATYNPAAKFDLVVTEVELRRNSAGRMLMARIYQPQGPGPFPTLLGLHGGGWNRKDRLAEQPMDRALAASGLLVVADTLTIGNSRRIFDYALAQKLLVIYEMDFLAEAGGLMSYGPDTDETSERAGALVGAAGVPCAIMQEGGYNTELIGGLLKQFITGVVG